MSSAFVQVAELKIVNALYNSKSARCAQHRAAKKSLGIPFVVKESGGISIHLFIYFCYRQCILISPPYQVRQKLEG